MHSRERLCLHRVRLPVDKPRMHVQHDESISLSRSFVACAIHVAMVRLSSSHKTLAMGIDCSVHELKAMFVCDDCVDSASSLYTTNS
jgi:hypothetical protein